MKSVINLKIDKDVLAENIRKLISEFLQDYPQCRDINLNTQIKAVKQKCGYALNVDVDIKIIL
jgi:hypothetical protein